MYMHWWMYSLSYTVIQKNIMSESSKLKSTLKTGQNPSKKLENTWAAPPWHCFFSWSERHCQSMSLQPVCLLVIGYSNLLLLWPSPSLYHRSTHMIYLSSLPRFSQIEFWWKVGVSPACIYSFGCRACHPDVLGSYFVLWSRLSCLPTVMWIVLLLFSKISLMV